MNDSNHLGDAILVDLWQRHKQTFPQVGRLVNIEVSKRIQGDMLGEEGLSRLRATMLSRSVIMEDLVASIFSTVCASKFCIAVAASKRCAVSSAIRIRMRGISDLELRANQLP